MRSDFLPLMSQQAYGLCHLLASKTLLALEAGGCAMLGQRCNANHCSAVLETHHISLEHTSWIISILVCVISIEESVPETLLFGVPSFKVKLPTRLSFLPLAPSNARCDGFTCIRHGSLHSWVGQVWTVLPDCCVLLSDGPQDGYQGIKTRTISAYAPTGY